MPRSLHYTVGSVAVAVLLAACSTEPLAPRALALPQSSRDVAATSAGFGAAASSNAALVVDGFLCNMGPAGATNDSHLVVTSGGTAVVTCHKTATPAPDATVIVKGALCATGPLTTTDMIFVWNPSGDASLMCRFKF